MDDEVMTCMHVFGGEEERGGRGYGFLEPLAEKLLDSSDS